MQPTRIDPGPGETLAEEFLDRHPAAAVLIVAIDEHDVATASLAGNPFALPRLTDAVGQINARLRVDARAHVRHLNRQIGATN